MSDTSEGGALRIDDAAVVWSVGHAERSERLADQPLVVVMHGRGSHENDLAQLLPGLPADAVYAFLRAPLIGEPYGIGGWTWFPPEAVPGPSQTAAARAVEAVLAWLDRVEHEFGAPPAIAAMGFSQGGAMSIQLLRTAPHRFAAAVDLSGVAALGDAPGDAALAAHPAPLFWGRDENDPVIAAAGIERSETVLPALFQVTARLYPGIAHSISPEELADVSAFLRHVLPLDAGDRVPAE
ncbi:MAG: hypothetical protein Q7T71_00440 [Herbiconiux sp.]|nr:hypothetical protein [Herbiconiux sp.]